MKNQTFCTDERLRAAGKGCYVVTATYAIIVMAHGFFPRLPDPAITLVGETAFAVFFLSYLVSLFRKSYQSKPMRALLFFTAAVYVTNSFYSIFLLTPPSSGKEGVVSAAQNEPAVPRPVKPHEPST